MKKQIIELLKKLEENIGDDCYIKYFSDHSGGVFNDEEEIFSFNKENELIELLKMHTIKG